MIINNGESTVFNGALTTIRRKRTRTVYYDQIEGDLAHCSVLDRHLNALILNEAVINGATYKLTRYGEDIFLDPQVAILPTTTTTTTTSTPTPKPVQINRIVYHHMITPQQCGVQNSSKLKLKVSKYTEKGYCWSCKQSVSSSVSGSYNSGSKRSLKPTGWKTSLPEEKFQSELTQKIDQADDKATSFEFPWFVRVGTGYSISATIKICFVYKQYCTYRYKGVIVQVR